MPVPDSNSTWQEEAKWIQDHQDELLADHEKQQDKERQVFGEWNCSSMRSRPIDWCHVDLRDRRARIQNATATTPDQVGSTEGGPKAVSEERFVSF